MPGRRRGPRDAGNGLDQPDLLVRRHTRGDERRDVLQRDRRAERQQPLPYGGVHLGLLPAAQPRVQSAERGNSVTEQCLFRVLYDGVTFGLIDESDTDRGVWFELHPDRLGFGEPRDGLYVT
jgi:hypothetical protein